MFTRAQFNASRRDAGLFSHSTIVCYYIKREYERTPWYVVSWTQREGGEEGKDKNKSCNNTATRAMLEHREGRFRWNANNRSIRARRRGHELKG